MTAFFNSPYKMNLEDKFKEAVEAVHELETRPSNENLLNLYGLFKQASEGDNENDRPGGFDFKAIAKHDSWANLKGKTKEEAMKEYIDLVHSLSE